jgi:hypothetical protein
MRGDTSVEVHIFQLELVLVVLLYSLPSFFSLCVCVLCSCSCCRAHLHSRREGVQMCIASLLHCKFAYLFASCVGGDASVNGSVGRGKNFCSSLLDSA